ncbi:bifunctional hydroxymethylpyrimidine kinase/phosphomethylpyrimidine kinase [uncultured Desulfobacter sp.]|uniref:bifunctional hydroxymethylpyrimidine kinase/phosphomethylpyrimidine kinase n=1 Tax=uncultured Desulfobacter sp. TaxID=240139 RepID=UPI002AAA6E9C|nr:bifunctional hydroxymethylpyrimidine kinase/phosphomethylpyrimidine kinase [uncultured Desulfobacter sp.]
MKTYYRALTIAGSDSGGGAGVQADLKTFSALGVFGMSAITALTAQNTHSVTGIFPVSPAFIGEQIDAVMDDIGTNAVKIGMLHSPEVIEMVADKLKQWQCPNVVLDPVMISKSGDKLLQEDAVAALTKHLLPLATVITPNLPEASVLLGKTIDTQDKMEDAAKALADLGAANVLVKGGHLASGPGIDLLHESASGQVTRYTEDRVDTQNSHGTGCTLSSAIAAGLARGLDLKAAVAQAKNYITEALKAGADIQTGSGHGPVHHFYALWGKV